MKVRVTVTPHFTKALKKLPPDRGKAAGESLAKFMVEPATPRLDFRPLKGKPGYFIIDGKRGDRIILWKVDEENYEAIDVGPHDNIYRRWNRLNL